MRVSCEIIRDILPLYYDKVCSKETCTLVEEHISDCAKCAEELEKLNSNFERNHHLQKGQCLFQH